MMSTDTSFANIIIHKIDMGCEQIVEKFLFIKQDIKKYM